MYLIKYANSDKSDGNGIFEQIHNVIENREVRIDETSPLYSRAKWEALKTKHFSRLNEEQIHFVQPMLDHLDRIVGKVESFPVET